VNFVNVCGNEHARRALEVALAGKHSIQFVGAHESQAADLCALAREWGVTARAVTPCPCGHYQDPTRTCACSADAVAKHRRRTLGPQHRFDISVEVALPHPDKIMRWIESGFAAGESNEIVLARVEAAASRPPVPWRLDQTGMSLLRSAIQQLQLAPGQVKSALGVAATIARLAESKTIAPAHIAEAIQYRSKTE
jgi:magnesium chelatase family protein